MTFSDIINQEATPCVYCIDFPNGMFYVGRTIDIRRRARKHQREAMSSKHTNLALQRCFRKYEGEEDWGIIKTFATAEEAVEFEASYIEEFWDDPMFLNQKKGDAIDEVFNKDKHTKTCYFMNPYTLRLVECDAVSTLRREWGYTGHAVYNRPYFLAYGETIEECERDAARLLVEHFEKIVKQNEKERVRELVKREKSRRKEMRRSWFHARNVVTGEHKVVKGIKGLNEAGLAQMWYKGRKRNDEWEVRRYGEDWKPVRDEVITPAKPIYGMDAEGRLMRWQSRGECARFFNGKNQSWVSKIMKRGGKYKGWRLSEAPIQNQDLFSSYF